MTSEHTKTKKEVLAELEHARRKTAELEAELARCESKEQIPACRSKERATLFQESEEKFRALVEMTTDFIWEVNANLDFTYVSSRVKDILGCDPSEILGQPIFFTMHPEEVTRVGRKARDIVRNKQPFRDLQYVSIHKEGRTLNLEASGAPMLSNTGELLGYRGATRDITERRKIEDALRESHHLLETIGSSLQAYLFVKDNEGRYTYANPTFLDTFRLTLAEVLGCTDLDIFPLEYAERFRANDQRIMVSGRSEAIEETVTLPADGLSHHFISNKVPLRSGGDDVTGILGISIDITDRKQTENELRKLSRAVEQASAAILVTDRDARIEFVNPAFTEITGYTAEEVLGKNPRLLKSGLHPPEFYKKMWGTLTGGGTWSREVLNKKKNGQMFWQYASIAPVKDEQGGTTHYVAVQEDITDLKRSQELLQEALTEFETIFENSAAGILQLKEGRFVHRINSRFTEILGYTPEDIVGKSTRILHSTEEVYREFEEKHYSALSAGETIHAEQEMHRKDRSTVWCDVHSKALFPPDLEKGIIFVIMDISARKELEQLRGDVERIMRHDLKTPLNGIIGLPQIMMQEGGLTQSHVKNLELIQATGQQMLDQVDLSLELFKMETGAYGFIPTTVDLTLILRKLENDLDMQAKKKDVGFEIPADGMPLSQSPPVKALGDELLCYSMLANILKNAVEASPPGERVTVRIQKWSSEVAVSIHNKGEVPKAMRDKFFDKYTTSGKTKGTGLGTYSAKLMARTQSGTIRLDSSKQDETTVVITLPASN